MFNKITYLLIYTSCGGTIQIDNFTFTFITNGSGKVTTEYY